MLCLMYHNNVMLLKPICSPLNLDRHYSEHVITGLVAGIMNVTPIIKCIHRREWDRQEPSLSTFKTPESATGHLECWRF